MNRQFLVTLSAAAVIFFCSPSARAQSENSQSTNRQWNSAQSNSMQSMNTNNNGNSERAQKEAAEMVPAHASLEKGLDAKDCRPGQQVTAKLGEDVQLKNGPNLPHGTLLIGKVTADQAKANDAKLAFRFTEAKLTDGTIVPIKAMVVAIEHGDQRMEYGFSNQVPARDLWNSKIYRIDQKGVVSGADLHSNITSRNSAMISTDKKDDVKIDAGSRLDMAIAERPNGMHGKNDNRTNPTM